MGVIHQSLSQFSTLTTSQAVIKELIKYDVPVILFSPASVRQIISVIAGKFFITPAQRNALNEVAEFAGKIGPIRYPHLQRLRVAIQLVIRVLNPGMINQGSFGMCGPAAIAVSTAQTEPLRYVTFAISLAERGIGLLGRRLVTPVPSILNFDLSGKDAMPQADWIVTTALRDDPTNLQESFTAESYGGSSGSVVFAWLVKCGFAQVVHMSHITFANMVECHPKNLLPPGIVVGDKLRTLMDAADLSQKGWRIFMQAFMQLSKSIESFKSIQVMEAELQQPLPSSRTKEEAALNTENPGYFGTVVGALKSVMGFDGGDTKHWTYVESLRINTINQTVTLTCCNHGMRYPSITVPLASFANKFLGFVAATDYA